MNPITRRTSTATARPRARVTTQTSSTSGGSVAAHTHATTAVISGRWTDDRLPERLGAISEQITNFDDATETGAWCADSSAANAPAASSWVGHTLRYQESVLGVFAVQHAYEVVSPYRAYRRTASIFWTAWAAI